MAAKTVSWTTSRSAYLSTARPIPKNRTPTIAPSKYRMGGCSLARMMSQPDSPDSATANKAASAASSTAPANL